MTKPILDALLAGEVVAEGSWQDFWASLMEEQLSPAEASAVLAAASATQLPAPTLCGLVRSLQPPRNPKEGISDVVNIVGTGGGPSTFNISTAAAVLAASCGVKVIKTGSSGYTSQLGASDLIARAGIKSAADEQEVQIHLAEFGIAFAGPRLYPTQLARLARLILPLGMKKFGALLNAIGPFLAIVPAGAQLTGLSRRVSLGVASALALSGPSRRYLFSTNSFGVDEILCFAENNLTSCPGQTEVAGPTTWPSLRHGSMADLEPVATSAAVEHIADVLGGRAAAGATGTVVVNAGAAMRLATGASWKAAVEQAVDAMRSGTGERLWHRLRTAARSSSDVFV